MNVKKKIMFREKSFLNFIQQNNKVFLSILFSLLLLPSSFAQNNQKVSVAGYISDETGESLVGVNVVVANTVIGTVTNMEGYYSLMVNPYDTLMISFIGYELKKIPVKGKANINIVLSSNATDLDEVVVVGYGEVKRANLLGAVSSMPAAEIEDFVAPSLTQLLEGRMPGINITQRQPSGSPATETQITIRAETSFGLAGGLLKDPSPLFIVDGFEVTKDNYDMLDPSEIESFSILKDASAAVYGSKGSNGVLLIKTKRGKEGKIKVNYSGSIGIGDATQHVEMMSAYDHARTINARYIDDSTKIISPIELEAIDNLDYNWLEEIWQPSTFSKHTINISGGSEKVKYFAGGSYVYTNANFPKMGYGKYSYRLGMDADITEGLKVSVTISNSHLDWKRPEGAGGYGTLRSPRWKPAFIDGLPVGNGTNAPLYFYELESFRYDIDRGNSLNVKASYDFQKIKGLKATAAYSRSENHGYIKRYRVPYTIYEFNHPSEEYKHILGNEINKTKVVTNDDSMFERYTNSNSYQINLSLNYSKTIGKHSFASFLTYEQTEGSGFEFQAVAEGVQTLGLELQQAFLTPFTNGSMNESGDLGSVLRLNYSYADKYLVESTLRYETTTRFAPGEREALFPAVSVGWVATKENFMKDNLSFINFMKIRTSVGLTGFASVSPYEYLQKFGISSDQYLFGGDNPAVGLSIGGKTDVVSTGVTWEKSLMRNMGLDLKFLDNNLSVSFDGYYTYQYDILDTRKIEFAHTAGLGEMPGENIGELKAWGFDGEIEYRGKIGRNVFWTISGNFQWGTNRVIYRPTEYPENDFRYPIGRSTYATDLEQGFVNNGIIRTQEQLDAINAEYMEKWGHEYTIDGKPAGLGAFHYEDIGRKGNTLEGEPRTVFEPDGSINDYDMKYLEKVGDVLTWKHFLPTHVPITISWKDIKVSMLWSMEYGIHNKAVDKAARGTADESNNAPAFWSDFWTPENPDAKYPNPFYNSSNQWVSTFWMKDIYKLRLQNLNISYSIPKRISKKWGVDQFRIFLVGTNLWSPVTTFKYKDDALNSYSSYPIQRTFSLGLNLTF